MKTTSFYMLIGAAAFSVLLMGEMDRALATSTSISIYSDAQTYVISDSAEANTSYYGKGAMMISAAVTDPNYLSGRVPRAMNALFSFDTSTAATGTTTSYVTNPVTGVDIVSAFNAAYGTGNWTITDVQMTLASKLLCSRYSSQQQRFQPDCLRKFHAKLASRQPEYQLGNLDHPANLPQH